MVAKWLIGLSLVAFSTSASAGPDVRYEAPQPWVEQVDIAPLLASKPNSNNFYVVLDKQTKFESGEQQTYIDLVMRIQSTELLTQVGSLLRGYWHPDRGNMIVHKLEIIRNSNTINSLENGTKFEVIRQEQGLNQQQINGILTATAQIKGLQLGDLVRYSFTTTATNTALQGRAESFTLLSTAEVESDFNRTRIVWPKSEQVNYKIHGDKLTSEVTEKSGYSILTMPAFAPKQTEMPADAPQRFKMKPSLAATQFATWQDVSKTTAKLYQTEGLIPTGSELETEIGKIANQTSDPSLRAALAVRFVQDKIRYLFNGLGAGNYVPQSPQETWQLRYGDCKAKTLLLLSMLKMLGIEAEPVLVNTTLKDGITTLPPGFMAFDHIMVRARIANRTLWLDGTASGTRLSDLGDAPPHRHALAVTTDGADLEEIGITKPGRPFKNVKLRYDMTTGLVLPAFFEMELKLRDDDASKLRSTQTQSNAKAFREELNAIVEKYSTESIVTESSFRFDEESNEGVITAKGLAYLDWTKKKQAARHNVWTVIDGKELEVDRKKREWRSIPLDLGSGWYYREDTEFVLPKFAASFQLAGVASVSDMIGGFKLDRAAQLNGNSVKFSEDYYLNQWELPSSEITTETRKITRLQDDDLAILAPTNYPDEWDEMAALLKGNQLAQHKRAFDAIVANDPDKDIAYRQRAYFFDLIGEHSLAEKDLAAALKLETTADTLKWRADLVRKAAPKTALTLLEEAVALEPDNFSAVETLAEIHAMAGRTNEAEMVVESAYKGGLSDDDTEMLRAYITLLSGKKDEALKILDVWVDSKDKGNESGALGIRCWYSALAKVELEAALEDCTKSIELSEDPSSIFDSRGLVYLQLDRVDEAIADYDAALELSPKQASSYYQRSLAKARKGDKAGSDKDMAAALFYSDNVSELFEHFGLVR